MPAHGASSGRATPLRSILIGLGFFFLGSLSDLWLHQHIDNLRIAFLDDALVGTVVGLLVFLYERRQARNQAALERTEFAARESEDRFRLLADTAPVLIWMSGPDRLCNYFNQPWLEFTGRSLEKELGMGWTEGVHPDDREFCFHTYASAFDLRLPFQMEYRLRRRDGKYRWVLDQGVPRFHADRSFAGYVGSAVDVTELKVAKDNLSSLSRKLIEVQEEERAHIARELHDDISQRMALLSLNLDSLKVSLSASNVAPGISLLLNDSCGLLRSVTSDIQNLSYRLHSSSLDLLGLETTAANYCRELSERQKVEIHFAPSGIPKKLPKEISLCLFRVLQEALQNAVRHSGTRSFEVFLRRESNQIHLLVCDQGVGFDTERTSGSWGLGLTSMRERLKHVDGHLSIDSKPLLGTTIHARVPLLTESISSHHKPAIPGVDQS